MQDQMRACNVAFYAKTYAHKFDSGNAVGEQH